MAVRETGIHWPSAWQFGLSLLAAFAFWSLGLAFAFMGVAQIISRGFPLQSVTPLFLFSAGLTLCGFLILPSAGFALVRLIGTPAETQIGPRRITARLTGWLRNPALSILALPPVVLLGYWITQDTNLAWLLLPPLHILAIGIPIFWLLHLGRRGLPSGSPRRAWGVFAGGLALGPALVMLLELITLGLFGLAGILALATRPELAEELNRLLEGVDYRSVSPEEALYLLSPFLLRPGVVYAVFAFAAGLVPLIEEMFKPVGVWLFGGESWTPAEGFVAGLLSGAGFALLENLALSSQPEGWAVLVSVRIGTALMHITTTGLTGWALVLAWRKRDYLRLGLTYLAVVMIHSLWNAMSLVSAGQALYPEQVELPAMLGQLSAAAPVGLGLLTLLVFGFLLWSNFTLRREVIQSD